MKFTHLLAAVLLALSFVGCADPSGDAGGLDMRSRSTGERDERLGNDPTQQNTGRGSNPENEPAPEGAPTQ